MSEGFRPIFSRKEKESPPFTNELQKLLEEKEKALEEKEEKLRFLEEEIERLGKELEAKERRLKDLEEELSIHKMKAGILENLEKEVKVSLKNVKESLKEDFLTLAKDVLREFLLSDAVSKEETLLKVLGNVFDGSLELKGSVRIYLNPSDVERVHELVGELAEKLRDKMEVEIIADSGILPGELRIETPKFIVERKHDEMLEEVLRGLGGG